MERGILGGPREDRAVTLPGLADRAPERRRTGRHRRFGAPDLRLEPGWEVEGESEPPGRQPDSPRPPRSPLVRTDGVLVTDPPGLAGIKGEATGGVLEEQPQLLERVPVVPDEPVHRLPLAYRRQLQ